MTPKAKNLKSFMRARVNEMDEAHLDPAQRAELVNTFIQYALGMRGKEEGIGQPLYWDLICYCFKMLQLHGMAHSGVDPELMKLLLIIDEKLEHIHYSGVLGESSFLGPGREEHEKLWVERIERFIDKERPGREE